MRRTNNTVEGWHRALTSTMGIPNPTILKIFEELKKRIQYQTREIEGIRRGNPSTPRRMAWENLNVRIHNATRLFNGMSHYDYLRSVALNLKFT